MPFISHVSFHLSNTYPTNLSVSSKHTLGKYKLIKHVNKANPNAIIKVKKHGQYFFIDSLTSLMNDSKSS